MFYAVSLPRYATTKRATGGILDLTTYDFTNNIFALSGEWEFYFGRLYTPEDFINIEAEGKSFIPVPLSWDAAGYPLHGYATYRLVLLTDETELKLLIPAIQNSSIVWINGQKVFEAGEPGITPSDTVAGLRNAFIRVYPQNGQAEIIIQAANFGWHTSGIVRNIETAQADTLLRDALLRRVLIGVLMGILLAIAFYHFILFIYSRRQWIYLVFSIICISALFRFIGEANGLSALLLPGGVGAGLILTYAIGLATQGFMLAIFTHIVFDMPISKARRIVYIASYLIPVVAVLVFPYSTVDFRIGYMAMLPMLMALISAIRLRKFADNPYNILFMVASGSFLYGIR